MFYTVIAGVPLDYKFNSLEQAQEHCYWEKLIALRNGRMETTSQIVAHAMNTYTVIAL